MESITKTYLLLTFITAGITAIVLIPDVTQQIGIAYTVGSRETESLFNFATETRMPSYCSNGIFDEGNEVDIDCGGRCGKCDIGKYCYENLDCSTAYCLESRCTEVNITNTTIS